MITVKPIRDLTNEKETIVKLSLANVLASRKRKVFFPSYIVGGLFALLVKTFIIPTVGVNIFILPFIVFVCSSLILSYLLYKRWIVWAYKHVKNTSALNEKLGIEQNESTAYSRFHERLINSKNHKVPIHKFSKELEAIPSQEEVKQGIRAQKKQFVRSIGRRSMPQEFQIKPKKLNAWLGNTMLVLWILFSGVTFLASIFTDYESSDFGEKIFSILLPLIFFLGGLYIAYSTYKIRITKKYLHLNSKGIDTHLTGFVTWSQIQYLQVKHSRSNSFTFSYLPSKNEELREEWIILSDYQATPYKFSNILQYYSEMEVDVVDNRMYE